ncbi:amidase [Cupriavidus basilensis]|uniref:amidase n=1 Tax=Cupriavidus basilensis TaxID=68895 RepID=UPI00157B47C2|nr:amidase [Cupriavidus basilensis]
MTDPTLLSVAELRMALSHRRLSPSALVQACLRRAAAAHAATHCFAALDDAGALARAIRLETHSAHSAARAPLWGIPFAHKDVLSDPARAPRAGSLFDDLIDDPVAARRPAAVLEALHLSGAIGLGATALDELSYGATGLNDHYGHCRNPWDPRCITGGSSGGAAAAVAARAVPFAIAADTGGSIRIPASMCGVVGLKPTWGRLSTRGAVPLSPSQDTLGIIARTARDCAAVLDALDPTAARVTTFDRISDLRSPLAGLRIGIARHPFFEITHDDGASVIARALLAFESLGASLHEQTVPGVEACDTAATVLTWREAIALHGERLRSHADRLARATRLRLETALAAGPDDYARALAYRPLALRRFVDHVFSACDVLVAPSVAVPTPRIASVAQDAAQAVRVTTSLLRANRCISYLGLPAVSLPVGFTPDGLPVGLQLIGRPWAEGTLLDACAAFQQATSWHRIEPVLNGTDVAGIAAEPDNG